LSVNLIGQYAGTNEKGTSILGLIKAAEHFGFQAKSAKGTIDSLTKIPLPAIAHIILKNGEYHYITIYKVDNKYIEYMDPASGYFHKKQLTMFKRVWSGVVVILLPGDGFEKDQKKHRTLNTSIIYSLEVLINKFRSLIRLKLR
jgi:ATP-binding cassette subfamily B protein